MSETIEDVRPPDPKTKAGAGRQKAKAKAARKAKRSNSKIKAGVKHQKAKAARKAKRSDKAGTKHQKAKAKAARKAKRLSPKVKAGAGHQKVKASRKAKRLSPKVKAGAGHQKVRASRKAGRPDKTKASARRQKTKGKTTVVGNDPRRPGTKPYKGQPHVDDGETSKATNAALQELGMSPIPQKVGTSPIPQKVGTSPIPQKVGTSPIPQKERAAYPDPDKMREYREAIDREKQGSQPLNDEERKDLLEAWESPKSQVLRILSNPQRLDEIMPKYEPSPEVKDLVEMAANCLICDSTLYKAGKTKGVTPIEGLERYQKRGGHTMLFHELGEAIERDGVMRMLISRISRRLIEGAIKESGHQDNPSITFSQYNRAMSQFGYTLQETRSKSETTSDKRSEEKKKSRIISQLRKKVRWHQTCELSSHKRFVLNYIEHRLYIISNSENDPNVFPESMYWLLFIIETDGRVDLWERINVIYGLVIKRRALNAKRRRYDIVIAEDALEAITFGWYGARCPECKGFTVINNGTHLECYCGNEFPVWFTAVCQRCLNTIDVKGPRTDRVICPRCWETWLSIDNEYKPMIEYVDVPESRMLVRPGRKARRRLIKYHVPQQFEAIVRDRVTRVILLEEALRRRQYIWLRSSIDTVWRPCLMCEPLIASMTAMPYIVHEGRSL